MGDRTDRPGLVVRRGGQPPLELEVGQEEPMEGAGVEVRAADERADRARRPIQATARDQQPGGGGLEQEAIRTLGDLDRRPKRDGEPLVAEITTGAGRPVAGRRADPRAREARPREDEVSHGEGAGPAVEPIDQRFEDPRGLVPRPIGRRSGRVRRGLQHEGQSAQQRQAPLELVPLEVAPPLLELDVSGEVRPGLELTEMRAEERLGPGEQPAGLLRATADGPPDRVLRC